MAAAKRFTRVTFCSMTSSNRRTAPASTVWASAYSSYFWPKVGSVYQIPYIIDPASGDLTNLNTAISQFNSTFSGVIQFVTRTSQTDYVNFNFDSNNTSGVCEAYEGRVGGEQTVGGSGSCTVATILHEMGHTIGVWHEQTRPDRNTYVNVNYNAVIKASRSNFDQLLDNDQELTLYDYASVMEYPAFSFSRNGEPCIESIPAGIPLSNPNGYSAGDIDGILRLYGAIPTQVTVTSNPPGLQVIVDGTTVTTPQTYAWALNSTHTLNVPSAPQTLSGINYVYGRWNDSTAVSHTITVTPGNNMVTPALDRARGHRVLGEFHPACSLRERDFARRHRNRYALTRTANLFEPLRPVLRYSPVGHAHRDAKCGPEFLRLP